VTLLELENASSFYGDFQALFRISLHIDAGETVAIIGANGAGKSTLLRTIAGLMRLRENAIRFDGQSIGHLPAHRRVGLGISLVPEGRRVFPSLSVKENLIVGQTRGRKGTWTLDTVMDLFPILRPLANRSGAVLSGGEQQAVAIGRALMANPRLLLLDEVSLGLAPIIIRQLYEAMPSISASGTTILLVEQNIDMALAVADRVYCLLEGRMALSGVPAELGRDRVTTAYFGI
jgi:branched-chain amino acid transport system ATP-binding protein